MPVVSRAGSQLDAESEHIRRHQVPARVTDASKGRGERLELSKTRGIRRSRNHAEPADPWGFSAILSLLLQAHTDKSQPLYLDRCVLTSERRRSPAQRAEARQLFHIARLALAQFCLPLPMARKHRARRARRQEEYEFDFSLICFRSR